jgi:hypothetical protein
MRVRPYLLGMTALAASVSLAALPTVLPAQKTSFRPSYNSIIVERFARRGSAPDSRLEFYLHDSLGHPIGSSKISLVGSNHARTSDSLIADLPINADHLDGVSPAAYTLVVRALGFRLLRHRITIGAKQLVKVTIVLEPDTTELIPWP